MNVYGLWPSNDYQSVSLVDVSHYDLHDDLVSTNALSTKWRPIRVMLQQFEDERRIPRPIGDCLYLNSGGQVFSSRACKVLCDLVRPNVEFLAVELDPPHDGWEFFLPHVLNELDALDIDRSKVDLFEGRVIGIDRFVFRPDVIDNVTVFRMPHNPQHAIYVTDPFRERVQQHGLTGFSFPLLWSDDAEVMADLERRRAAATKKHVRANAGPPVVERSLTRSDRRAIEAAVKEARLLLDLENDELVEIVQQHIHDRILEARNPSKHSDSDLKRLSVALGCLWGQTICDEIQWEWTKVEVADSIHWAVVPPDRAFMVLPVPFIGDLLAHPESDQTSAVTFKYLRSGQLKAGVPGELQRFQVNYIVPPA